MTAALSYLDDLGLADKLTWTVDDLASLPKDLRYELINGRLILPAPLPDHNDIGVELVFALRVNCPRGFRPYTDISLEFNAGNEPRPDVAVIRRRPIKRTPVPIEDTLLAVEVLSPSNTASEMSSKAKMYAAAGVDHYWVVDPWHAGGIKLTEYRRGVGGYEEICSTRGIFTTDKPFPITVDLPALTAWIDEPIPGDDDER